ncbi:hypothetical protein niasHS_002311 [Heterodera schachtii]|uniref:Uncharacterized protein n=1 Tax=Heterodera schachtii TaxID=97005 RepID=A0ABD2KJK8_HETSC
MVEGGGKLLLEERNGTGQKAKCKWNEMALLGRGREGDAEGKVQADGQMAIPSQCPLSPFFHPRVQFPVFPSPVIPSPRPIPRFQFPVFPSPCPIPRFSIPRYSISPSNSPRFQFPVFPSPCPIPRFSIPRYSISLSNSPLSIPVFHPRVQFPVLQSPCPSVHCLRCAVLHPPRPLSVPFVSLFSGVRPSLFLFSGPLPLNWFRFALRLLS